MTKGAVHVDSYKFTEESDSEKVSVSIDNNAVTAMNLVSPFLEHGVEKNTNRKLYAGSRTH